MTTDNILRKYQDMANIRSDFNTINNKNFLLPTMGEMVEEDLMNDLLQQFVDGDSNNEFNNQSHLDAAYYVEQPFSTQPGYHPVEAAFVLKARALADSTKDLTWELNKYDGDTTAFLVNDLNDGGQGFTFNDGKSYNSFKDYYKKVGGTRSLTIRHVGIDAPEIPHYEIQAVPKSSSKYIIEEMTYKELKQLASKNVPVYYVKHPVNADKTKVVPRKDNEKIKLLKAESENRTVYYEIIKKHNPNFIPDANSQYDYYTILGKKDESESNTIVDGYKAQQLIKEKLASASEILLVVDANQIGIKRTSGTNITFNSLYYGTEAIEHLLNEWKKSYKDIPETTYSYTPYGMDKYSRSMGAIYIKETLDGKQQWVNLNKYVAALTEHTETNPDFNESPELQEMKNGMSDAFDIWSYNKDNIEWLDSFNKLTSKSYQNKINFHKEITGIDFTQERNCALMIGDTLMLVPPESIRNITQVYYEKLPNMRSKGTMAKQMGQNEHMLEISLYFYDDMGINGIPYKHEHPNGQKQIYWMNGLRSLLAQFKVAPFLPIENGYVNDVLGVEAVSLMNIHLETVKGFPRLMKAVLSLREFNYRTFMPDLPVDDAYGETDGQLAQLNPLFAKCFNWEIFRYYYQKAIKAGDELESLDYASYDYNLKFYSSKNSIGRWLFCPPDGLGSRVSFFIPDENWLEQALTLKKQRDTNPLSNYAGVELSTNAINFLTDLNLLNKRIGNVVNKKAKDFEKAVSDLISLHNKDDKHIYSNIPSFKFTNNPDESNGVYIKNISDSSTYSSVYLNDGFFNTKKKDFQSKYIKPIYSGFLKEVNDASYMNSMQMNEAIRWDDINKQYKITWEFVINLNTQAITDDDLINIREVLSKASEVKMEKVFKDNQIKVNFSMKFEPGSISTGGFFDNSSPDLSGKGDIDGRLVAGDTGENAGTNSLKFNDSYDTKCLDSIIKVLDENNQVEGDVVENTNNQAIDYFIQDYKNPANMPFVPYVQDIVCDGFGSSMSNSFTNISLKAIEGVGPQYLGGQDTILELSLLTDDIVVVSALNNLPMMASSMAKRYKRVLPAWPIKIRSAMTNLLGVSEVLVDNIEVSTVDGLPGVYSIAMRLTSVDRTQRQREALRRLDIKPTGGNVDYNGHSNLAIQNFFAIEDNLSKAELYPDLDLPSIKELAKLGYRYVKYAGQNRSYPDPDFYVMYNYPYTSLIIKKLVKEQISKQLLNIDGDEKHLQSFDYKDTMGVKLATKVSAYTGMSVEDNPDSKQAAEYTKILEEQRKTVQETIRNMKNLNDYEKEEVKEKFELSSIMKYLTMCDLNDGWEIRPGWRAPLCDDATNDAIRELNKTDNLYAKDIKTIRADALRLIDNILGKPMNGYDLDDNSLGYPNIIAAKAVNNLFFDNANGKKLIELLCPGVEITKAEITKGNSMLGNLDNVDFTKHYFNEPSPLNFLAGYVFASGCALSGHEEYRYGATMDKWRPNHHGYATDLGAAIYAEDEQNGTRVLMPYCREDRIAGKSTLSTRIDSAIKNGTSYGAFRITKYSVTAVVSEIGDRTDDTIMYGGNYYDATYKDKSNEDESSKKRVKAGFLDPYYNYISDDRDNEELKKYKRSILLNKQANTEAFLRNMLVQLRKMILDGLLISEIDIVSRNFDELYSELNITNMVDTVYDAGKKADSQGGKKTDTEIGAALKELGFNADEMQELLKSIKEANQRSLCARLVYPFLTAITKSSSDIYSTLKFRDYKALNALTGYIEDGDQNSESRSTVIKFLSALAGINLTLQKEGKNESSVSPSQMLINNMMKDIYIQASDDPRAYLMHSFYDMLVNDKRGRLVRAFPTYYVIFVDEGRKIGSWKLHDNFYNMNSISEIQVVKSRKIAADTCTITMNNMFNSYTREPDITTTQQYVDIYGLRDVFDSIFSPKAYFDKEKRIRLRQTVPDKVVLQPGIRIHVRMGYSADGSKVPIVFNGKVAEVEVGDVAQIVAQGDGHELMNPLNAFGEMEVTSLDPAQSPVTWFKDIRGSLASGGETPRDLLAKLLTAKHGGWKKMTNVAFDGRWFNDNPFGIMHFGDPKYDGIFDLGEVVQNLYEVSDETLLKGVNELQTEEYANKISPIINTSLQDKTFWDVLHLAANTGLEYVGAVRDFGFRSTIFLGKPNHYYAYKYEMIDNKVVERRKPFQQYHYFDSYNDIIYNSIKASEAQMRTNAVGIWQSSAPLWGREQSTVGPIYLDMNIYPEYQKSMTVDTGLLAAGNGGIDIPFVDNFAEEWNLNPNDNKVNKSTAWRVTANALKNSVKDMYQGDVGVIGDPSVKPHDRIYIYDTYEDMMGMFEVEAVIHTMSVETGFTTSVMPDVIARHDDKFEPAVQNLMGSMAAVLGMTVTGGIADTLFSFTMGNKIKSVVAKSKEMYGASTRLNKFASDFGNASGMKAYLDKHPNAKNMFETLNFNIGQDDLDIHHMMKLIDDLSDMTLEGGMKTNISIFSQMLNKYSRLDMEAYANAIDSASKKDKWGVNKESIKDDDLKLVRKEMYNAKNQLDTDIDFNKLKIHEFKDELLKNTELLDDITNLDIHRTLNKWGKETVIETTPDNVRLLSEILNDKNVQKAIKEEKLIVSNLDEFYIGFKKVFDSSSHKIKFKGLAKTLKGGDIINDILKIIKGVIKFNWASILIDAAISTMVYCFTKDAKSMFTRWLQGVQAVDVYPLKRNGKPLIAGMNGHKGSVQGHPVQQGYDSIQGMVLEFIDDIKSLDGNFKFMDGLVDTFVDKNIFNQLSLEWRRELGIENPEDTGALDETSEDFKQNVYNAVSSAYAANANHAYSIMTKYRKESFDTKGRTDETYKHYEIKGVTASSISSNVKVQKLYYINRDDDIWRAITDDRFVVAHSKGYTNLVTIPFESGSEKVPVFIEGNIIDTPLVQEDALYILKCLATDESLKKGTIHFKSGARLNDVKMTWKNTGFVFTIEYKALALGDDNKLQEALDRIKEATKMNSQKGMFAYQKKNGKFIVSVYPPIQDTVKLKEEEK